MTEADAAILDKPVVYSGEGLSVRSLETMIEKERAHQNVRVQELTQLRERNVEIQKSLEEEVGKLRKLSDYVATGSFGGFWANMKELLGKLPGLGRLGITRRSIEELLRQQYEISCRRVKEAAEYADRLEVAEKELYDEVDRLNKAIIEAARNEATAAAYVLEVNRLREGLEARLAAAEPAGVEAREVQAELDRTRRVLAEHSTRLQLYNTAEERLDRLKQSTALLSETIANLRSDISQYVMAAGEKLDLVAGQLRAIGTAADASVVMLEMKRSLDVMGDSLNQTTRFVAETQAYFRQNLDKLVGELEVYDAETHRLLEANLAVSREAEQRRIEEAVRLAREFQASQPGVG